MSLDFSFLLDNWRWWGLYALGAWVGLTLPDIDLWPTLKLGHRSGWTHGLFFPVVVYLGAPVGDLLPFLLGVLPAMAVHLAADCLPESWEGGAKITFAPLSEGRLPMLASLGWLVLGIAGCWVVWVRLMPAVPALWWPAVLMSVVAGGRYARGHGVLPVAGGLLAGGLALLSR